MEFATLAKHFEALEDTTKRLEMTGIVVEVLSGLEGADEVEAFVRLLQGKVRPDWEGVELGLAEKLVLHVIARAGGLDAKAGGVDVATKAYHDKGDLGLAAEAMLAKKQGAAQVGLMAFGDDTQSDGLSTVEVHTRLLAIARATGSGSQEDKKQLLWRLLTDVGPLEARYVIRAVAGRLRLGVSDMTLLDALAVWTTPDRRVVSVTERDDDERASLQAARDRLEAAYDRCSDLARVAAALFAGGLAEVDRIPITHGVPLRPMAAERCKTLADVLERAADEQGRVAAEVKYDGLRMQAHVAADGSVRLFSRRMEDLTSQFPDVQDLLAAAHQGPGCIVEMECVAIDADGAIQPFQLVSRRRGRKTGLGEDARQETALGEGAAVASTMMDEVPVAVFIFDTLAVDGASTMPEPYTRRRQRIEELFVLDARVRIATMQECHDEDGLTTFFESAVAEGGEGMMVKRLDAPYKAGNRGFDWIKFKTDYTEELVDTMDLVVVGAFHGRGRRAGWYGALLCAAYDPDTQTWPTVCKVGTGFDDATLISLKERLAPHTVAERPNEVHTDLKPDAWMAPAIVCEVQAAELTLSPVHHAARDRIKEGAGIAARFPRFTGWRDDKAADQATTVEEIVAMYQD